MIEKLKLIMRQIITVCAIVSCIINISTGEVPAITLKTGAKMPLIGYGTWKVVGVEVENALNQALQIGYRHIDTATYYQNEQDIGNVLKKWFTSGKLKREDVFITTKLPFSATHPDLVSRYLQESLQNLQLTYVDMYLIHWPFYIPEISFNADGLIRIDEPTDLLGTWKAMEAEFNAGRAKAIGVSNFNQSQLQRVMTHGKIPPANLQIELHVYLQQTSLVEFCKENGIAVTSYSSLGSRGSLQTPLDDKKLPPNMLEDKVIIGIAENHGKTAAQILLKYLVQQNIIVIPKSTNEKRIRQNFEIFDFQLTPKEMEQIADLDKGEEGRVVRISQHLKGLEKHPEYPHGY